MTSENKSNIEAYLGQIGCELNFEELETVFMVLNCREDYVRRDIFMITLKEFSGMPLDEKKEADRKKAEDLLTSLERKGFIKKESYPDRIVLTEKALSAIGKLTRKTKFWMSFSAKRWRQVIVQKKKHEGISYCEIKIIRELMDKEEVSGSFAVNNCFISSRDLLSMADRKRISVDERTYLIRRGLRFIEGVAEAVHYVESGKVKDNVSEWHKSLDALFSSLRSDSLRSWKARYEEAHALAREFDACPVGLPGECKDVFKEDMDSIIPLRQLSLRDLDLKINIKKGFGYRADVTRHSFDGLIIEFILSGYKPMYDYIRIEGTKQKMLDLFTNIKNEIEKMSNAKGLKMEKARVGSFEVNGNGKDVMIDILILAQTRNDKIAAISHSELCAILEAIRQYPDN